MKLKKFISGALACAIMLTQFSAAVLPTYATGMSAVDPPSISNVQEPSVVENQLEGEQTSEEPTATPAEDVKSLVEIAVDAFNAVPEDVKVVAEGQEGHEAYVSALTLAQTAKAAFDGLTAEKQETAKEQLGLKYDTVITLLEAKPTVEAEAQEDITTEQQPNVTPEQQPNAATEQVKERIEIGEAVTDYELLGGVTVTFGTGDNAEINIKVNDSGRTYGEEYIPSGVTLTVNGLTAEEQGKFKYTEAFKNGDKLISMSIISVLGEGVSGTIPQDAKTSAGVYSASVSFGADSVTYMGKTFKINAVPTGKIQVAKRPVTVKADDAYKVYGNSDPTFSYTVINGSIIGNDQLYSGHGGNGLYRVHAGKTTEKVSSEGYPILSDLNNPNYAIKYEAGGKLYVSQATLTISGGFEGKDGEFVEKFTREYGAETPKLKYKVSGMAPSDTLADIGEITVSCVANISSAPNSFNVEVSGGKKDEVNYSVIYVNGTLNVVKRAITIDVKDAGKKFGEVDPTLEYIITAPNAKTPTAPDVADDGTKLAILTGTITREAGENVGSYGIINGYDAVKNSNYDIKLVANDFLIGQSRLKVTVNDSEKIYGDANPDFTVKYEGFQNGENETNNSLTGDLIFTTDAINTSEIDEYAVSVSGLGSDGNYAIEYFDGKLEITPRPITIEIADKTSEYGEELVDLEYEITSDAGEDTLVFIGADTFTGKVFIETEDGLAPKNAGKYPISASFDNPNYSLTINKGEYTITKATLTVEAGFEDKDGNFAASSSREYGNKDGAFKFIVNGLKNGDVTNDEASDKNIGDIVIVNTATSTSVPGKYAVVASGLGEQTTNYNVEYTNGELVVAPREVLITVDNVGKLYGETDPVITYKATAPNATNIEDATKSHDGQALEALNGTFARANGEAVGTYAILHNFTAEKNPCYTITVKDSGFTIGKALLNVIVNDEEKIYGDNNPSFTVRYEGLANGETATDNSLTGSLEYQTLANKLSAVDKYDVTVSGLSSEGNYEIQYTKGSLNIIPRPITITLGWHSSEYGEPLEELSFSSQYTGNKSKPSFIGEDKFTGKIFIETENGLDPVDVGFYAIKGIFDNANYSTTFIDGKYAIGTAPIEVRIINSAKLYGTETKAPEFEFVGFKGEDGSFANRVKSAISARTPYLLPEITVIISDDVAGIKGYVGAGVNDVSIYEDAFKFEGVTSGNYAYKPATGDLQVSRLKVTDVMYHVDGSVKGNDVYGSNVTFKAADGYQISQSDALEGNTWNDVIYITGDGSHNVNFYAKRVSDGAVTTVGSKNFRIDTYVAPVNGEPVIVAPIHNPPTGISFLQSLASKDKLLTSIAMLVVALTGLIFIAAGARKQIVLRREQEEIGEYEEEIIPEEEIL